MSVVKAVDRAYTADMATLADDVRIVCGYIGGHTLHAWTPAEVETVRASGRHWWAIYVPVQYQAWDAQTGTDAADACIAKLPDYDFPKADPVFIDLEYDTYMQSPVGAKAGIAAFKTRMRQAGYTQPFAYTPGSLGIDWVASWRDGPAPTALPAGWIGQQYADPQISGDEWDHSVFAQAVYAADPPPTPAPPDDEDAMVIFGIARTPDGSIYKIAYLDNKYAKIPSPAVLQQVKDMHARNWKPDQVLTFDTPNMDRFGTEVAWGQLS